MEIHKTKIIIVSLFALAFLERVFFDLGPNIELVTTAMLFTSVYWGIKQSFWLTLAILATTDIAIGNTNIFIFTWTGFLFPAILVDKFPGLAKSFGLEKIFRGTGAGIISNLFFFFWTNFGVWLLDSWGMYTNGLSGLMMSYIIALPFLKYQFISTLVFVPLGFTVLEVLLTPDRRLNLAE